MSSVDARVFSEELASLYQLIAESEDVETGGELLGLWSHQGSPTIMLVTGPDDDATRTKTHFLQPPDIHMMIERYMWDRFGLQVLGIWHSHHRLGLTELSDGDRHRTKRYADTHGRARYVEFLGYIDPAGRPRIRPYLYADAGQLAESPVEILELPGRSPIRDTLRSDPPPTALHTSLLLGGARTPWTTRPGPEPGETEDDAAEDAVPSYSLEADILVPEPEPEPAPSPSSERQRPSFAQGAPQRADVAADIVLALEAALARLPESATRLVKLRIDASGLILRIDPPGRRASLFFPIESPTEMECRTTSVYPVIYTARPRQPLADFYYERLSDLLDMPAPGTQRLAPTWNQGRPV